MLFECDKTTSENIYKLLVSTVVPRPIAWVTTQDVDGSVNAAPFSFFNAVSGNPPVVAIGIGGRGPGDVKDTGGNIRRTGQFVVNLVSNALAEKMNITAIDFEKQVNELAEAGLHTAPSSRVKAPRIAESPVSFECERLVIVEVGVDRAVILGKVDPRHVEAVCGTSIPAPSVHASDQIEPRRIDVALLLVQHELIGHMDRHHPAQHHCTVNANLHDH